MNWNLIVWVTANALAAWYSLYLMKRGYLYLSNIGPFFDKLQEKAEKIETQEEMEKLQSMLRAANRVGKVGLIYSALGLIGLNGLIILNLLLVLS